jgi:hypothetical protein
MIENMTTLEKIIEATKGRFFRATFVKKDGSTRVMVGRLGVISHLKGGDARYDKSKYIGVYDVQAGGYRLISRETLKEVKFGGRVYR